MEANMIMNNLRMCCLEVSDKLFDKARLHHAVIKFFKLCCDPKANLVDSASRFVTLISMPSPVIHFYSRKYKDRAASGLRWTPENMHTMKSDPDKVNCPNCIAAYPKEGVLDVRDTEGGVEGLALARGEPVPVDDPGTRAKNEAGFEQVLEYWLRHSSD
jgi:hypothetical protein